MRRCNYHFKSPHNFLPRPGSVSFRIMDGGAGWVQLFHHEEVRQLVKSKKVQVVTLPLMRRHMFAVHFLLHKSSIFALYWRCLFFRSARASWNTSVRPLVSPLVRMKNLDHIYTGIYSL